MEALALLFAIGVFIALLVPEKRPKPKSPGDKLFEGLEATYKALTGGGDGNKKDSKSSFWENPWSIVLSTILLGILLTYVL
ncbi:MAG: hypothetical protein ACFBSG_19065 [Leptolyngbyaceae cyanobacterium]